MDLTIKEETTVKYEVDGRTFYDKKSAESYVLSKKRQLLAEEANDVLVNTYAATPQGKEVLKAFHEQYHDEDVTGSREDWLMDDMIDQIGTDIEEFMYQYASALKIFGDEFLSSYLKKYVLIQ